MKEYTLLSIISVFLALFLDRVSRIRILKRAEYYIFLLVIIIFKFLVNGHLTGKKIVLYEPRFFLGIRLGSIPLEDFLFGFSMVTIAIITWEFFKSKQE